MKKLSKFVLVAIGMVLAMGVVSCNKSNTDEPTGPKAKYTIMLYGCGGGDIDSQLEWALEDAVKALGVENNQVSYTVMYSMSSTDKEFQPTYRGEKGKTYRYVLSKDTDLTQAGYREKYFYKNASEVELYKSSTIVDFIQWSVKNAPAENYIIEFVNHGGGFDLDTEVLTKGIAYDDNHKDADGYGKGIALCTIADALKAAGVHMKAIYWNGCMMGQLEVLTEVAPYCDYQFASSHVAFVEQFHVLALINALNQEPNDFEKAAKVHEAILKGNGETDKNSILYTFTHAWNKETQKSDNRVNGDFACWRSAKVAAINEQVGKLGALLVKAYKNEDEKANVNFATGSVYLYEMGYGYADVLDYAQKLAPEFENKDLKAEAETIAADLKKTIADANVYRISASNIQSADNKLITTKEGTFSLSVSLFAGKDESDYLYSPKVRSNYKNSAFDKATAWSNWLDINEFRVSSDSNHPNLTNPGNDTSWELFWLDDNYED